MQPCQKNSRSFFEKLQNAEGLDLRDNRGKRHDLAVVLVGVTIALLANRDGCLSSIQRHLAHHYDRLVTALGVEKRRPVSRSQLPLISAELRPLIGYVFLTHRSLEPLVASTMSMR